jgi:threonine/homoserine/homoserine lactone efflux protein
VAGTQIGLALMMLVLLAGLQAVMAFVGAWFTRIKLAGAAYLVWMGWKLITARPTEPGQETPVPGRQLRRAGTGSEPVQPKSAIVRRRFHPAIPGKW